MQGAKVDTYISDVGNLSEISQNNDILDTGGINEKRKYNDSRDSNCTSNEQTDDRISTEFIKLKNSKENKYVYVGEQNHNNGRTVG